MREHERLLGRARGYIEAQPVGWERSAYSRRAYERYARVGLDGFRDWAVSTSTAEHLVRSGMRMVALRRLEECAAALEAALAAGDGPAADGAAAKVGEALAMLAQVPRRVRQGSGGLSRDRGKSRAEVRP